MKTHRYNKFYSSLCSILFAAAFALSVAACGGGQSIDDSCNAICTKVLNCLGETDPAAQQQCAAECTADGEGAAACEEAIYDADDCIQTAECAAVLDGSACVNETQTLENACPNA